MKKRLTREEHRILGLKLQAAYQEITNAVVQVGNAYPIADPAVRAALRAQSTLSRLKSALDDHAMEDTSWVDADRCYYGASIRAVYELIPETHGPPASCASHAETEPNGQ